MKIDRDWLLSQAQALGFERMAVMRADDVPSLYSVWRADTAEGKPFAFLSGMPTDPRGQMPEAKCVILLARSYPLHLSYPAQCARVSGYYFAEQQAYVHAGLFIERIAKMGAHAIRAGLPLKPLALAAGFGVYGANTVIVRDEAHQLFQAIITDAEIEPTAPLSTRAERAEALDSGAACPARALTAGQLDPSRCIRNFMMRGVSVPEHLRKHMGTRLLGCDTCLRPYPDILSAPLPPWYEELFSFQSLLDPKALLRNKARLAEAIGANYARPQRILAQAALAAGNAQNREAYAPLLAPLTTHEDPVVAEHAQWALNQTG